MDNNEQAKIVQIAREYGLFMAKWLYLPAEDIALTINGQKTAHLFYCIREIEEVEYKPFYRTWKPYREWAKTDKSPRHIINRVPFLKNQHVQNKGFAVREPFFRNEMGFAYIADNYDKLPREPISPAFFPSEKVRLVMELKSCELVRIHDLTDEEMDAVGVLDLDELSIKWAKWNKKFYNRDYYGQIQWDINPFAYLIHWEVISHDRIQQARRDHPNPWWHLAGNATTE